ncbi:RIP metalloprotease RseP [Thermoproteota archaeon]
MGIFITIIALSFVIFIHEFGHMMAAIWAGIGVREFAIGMGPKVIGRTIKGIYFSVRILPVGGFVSLAGIDDEEDLHTPEDIDFYEKPIPKRLVTIVAGAAMNILTGVVVFILVAFFVGVSTLDNSLASVSMNSPAYEAGLREGDKVTALNQNPVNVVEKDLIGGINNSQGRTISLTVERIVKNDTKTLSFTVTPQKNKEENRYTIGIGLKTLTKRFHPILAVKFGLSESFRYIKMVFVGIGWLISGKVGLKDMAGPIGIVQFASYSFSQGFVSFLGIMAMISISLGVINLFPIPVLDGGHVVMILIEAVRGKRVTKKWETLVNNTGAMVLITLMVLIVFNDIIHWSDRVLFLKSLGN